MKLSYIQRLSFYFILIFAVFTAGIIALERINEKGFKTQLMEEKLNSYVEIVESLNQPSAENLDQLSAIFPENLRLTVMDLKGNVLFDNEVQNSKTLENHLHRPEIIAAQKTGKGQDIRESATINKPFFYFAKKHGDQYIRVALPYNLQVQRFLEPDNIFLYSILVLFISIFILMFFVARRFNKTITKLRDFILYPDKARDFNFPNDELGEISHKITENYRLLSRQKKEVDAQKEKLLQHVKSSKEGICFFTPTARVSFYNDFFIQYLNILSNEEVARPEVILTESTFKEFQNFLTTGTKNYLETQIQKQGRTISFKVIRFENGSFEVILNDISLQEKTKRLKRDLTDNIAHELRTPVANIRGYLETIQEQKLTEEQKNHFLEQAFKQSVQLSDLISDVRLLSKIEESGEETFDIDTVNVNQQLERLKEDFDKELKEKNILLNCDFKEEILIRGNQNLIYSIFRNLIDNSIKYGGQNISIFIKNYKHEGGYYYFSYFDTGKGIPDEKHLPRIFERFYRISEGRTRDTGGTGLGLSIVRNAVLFHRGNIIAKNKKEAGLEFLFTLHE